MNPTCPKCAASLKDDYGMVTCSSCGSILFIDMEGLAHMSSDSPESDAAEQEPEVSASPAMSEDLANDVPLFNPLDAMDASEEVLPFSPATENHGDTTESTVEESGFPSPFDSVPEAQDSNGSEDGTSLGFEPASAEGDFSMDAFLGYQPPEEAGQASGTPSGPDDIGPAGDPLGLSEYANSELSQAKDGPLLFRILISGIDSKEMRESLREAIDDSRFAWDPDEIMSQIIKGALAIDHVSPIKASILINRIKRMPVRIRWEQYAVTRMENPS